MSLNHLHWNPGTWGKGLVHLPDKTIHTWNTSGQDRGEGHGQYGHPHHDEYMTGQLGYPDIDSGYKNMGSPVYIDPTGTICSVDFHDNRDTEHYNLYEKADSRLKKNEFQGWKFGKTADLEKGPGNHQINWRPGGWGKGILFRNADVHTWGTSNNGGTYEDNDGRPYHADYIKRHLNDQPPARTEQNFIIRPDGTTTASPIYQKAIVGADPRLRMPGEGKDTWKFGKWVSDDDASDTPSAIVLHEKDEYGNNKIKTWRGDEHLKYMEKN